MNWNTLTETTQLELIKSESALHPVLIFKHSTRCSISRTVLDRLERNWNQEDLRNLKPYYLDLLTFRNVSNEVSQVFQIEHESPQVLIIEKGKAVYTNSHFGIDYAALKEFAKN